MEILCILTIILIEPDNVHKSKIIRTAPHCFKVAAKTSLDLLNPFIFDHLFPVQHAIVGQQIRPITAENSSFREIATHRELAHRAMLGARNDPHFMTLILMCFFLWITIT
jgi:hypothetical protein